MDAKTTGQFICRLRKENNLTQAALAEKLNISNRTISKWENGDGYPDITILPELSKTLGVTVDELLAGNKSEAVAEIKVTEVENRDNLDNIFLITYVISLFVGIFAAILGGITELYSIWAFRILFYTHWEIMFVAVSLFAIIVSGLVFSIGTARLGVSYSKEEIIKKIGRKAWLLALILAIFPLTFIMRIIIWLDWLISSPIWVGVILIPILLAFIIVFKVLYKKFAKKD